MTGRPERAPLQVLAGFVAAGILLAGAYVVLAPFLVPITWAAILAYATWPLYQRVLDLCRGRGLVAALMMTLLVILAVALPITLISLALVDDVASVFRTLRTWSTELPDLPHWAAELPMIGPTLAAWHATLRANPGALRTLLVGYAAGWSQAALSAAGDVGRNLARLALTLVTVFFLYRHGEDLLGQTTRVLDRLAGDQVKRRLDVVGATVRAVFYGILLTALVQGVLAGLGFWVARVPGAVLLGALTAFLAFLPFGPPLVWLPVGVWVLVTGDAWWKGVGLLLWGMVVVSGADNVIRPYFIGGATKVPFLLVLFGVLGGLAAFGLLGLFVGPTVLAVGLVLWREWAVGADEPELAPTGPAPR